METDAHAQDETAESGPSSGCATPTQDLHIRDLVPLIAPRDLKAELPASEAALQTVVTSRNAIQRVLSGEDPRILAVVGPCSIHDQRAAREYAARLKELSDRVQDQVLVVMRVYFEKPRTTVGWKGLINDPHLDDSFAIETGLRRARELLREITATGLATACEMLEPITPQYIADLVSWAAIGARTTESPTHRQMASGLSMPVGFKNGTDGGLQVAIDAMISAQTPHSFLGIDGDGRICIVHTRGNPFGHLILRGGRLGANYDAAHIANAVNALQAANLPAGVMIDCSHANSNKDHSRQVDVFRAVLRQRLAGNRHIVGLMLESHLHPGKQAHNPGADPNQLRYGVSITDACLGWDDTAKLLVEARDQLQSAPRVPSQTQPHAQATL